MRGGLLLLTLALLGLTLGHIPREGKWRITPQKTSSKIITLPPQDNQGLLSQEDASHGGYQFASPIYFPIPLLEKGAVTSLSDGAKVWSVTIISKGALNLGLTFEDFYLPEGAELHFSGEKEARGAFTSHNNPRDGHFTIFPFEGPFITVEYFQPAHVKQAPSLNIIHVAHGYKPLGYGDSGSCNINVACDNGKWANEIRSVGMLLSGFGSRFCSGALVNNVENNGDQLFLTAAHCSVGSSDQIMFNYQSATCSPNQDGPTDNVVGQLTRLGSNTFSDFTLLRIEEQIPSRWNLYLNGVSGENVAPSSMTGIHHPAGDTKKISFANKKGVPDRWSAAEPGSWHWRVSSWDEGTTEGGSSGSPLFDQNQRVVGQLHGGTASCRSNTWDSYGATWASWDLGLGSALDPKGTGLLVINGTDLNLARGF